MLHSLKGAVSRFADPPARALARASISPTTITLAGLVFVAASCVFLLQTYNLLLFCALITASCLVDVLDGAVARLSGRVTKFGAYIDAMCDRAAEAMAVLSVAYVTGYWELSSVMLVGAMLVSYAKARAAIEAPVSNTEWPDLMERGERDVIWVAGLAASRLLRWRPLGHDLFWWTLVVMTVLIYLTVVQRVLRAKRLIETRG